MGRRPDPNKKSRIIQTAAGVFARYGYAGTRIITIAEAAGIGKGTVYEYFSSKEDLFFAVFQYLIRETTDHSHAGPTDRVASAAERIASVAESVVETWLPRLDLYSLVMEFWSAATTLPSREKFKAAFCQAYADLRAIATELIRQGIAGGEFDPAVDPAIISAALVGALDSMLLQAWLDPDFDIKAASRIFINVMVQGLRPTIHATGCTERGLAVETHLK